MKKIIALIVVICIIACACVFVVLSKKNVSENITPNTEIELANNTTESDNTETPKAEPKDDFYAQKPGESISEYTYRCFGYIPSQQILLQYNDLEGYYKYYGEDLPKYDSATNSPRYPGLTISSAPMLDGENIAEYTYRTFGYWPSQQQLNTALKYAQTASVNEATEEENPNEYEDPWELYKKNQKDIANDETINNPKAKLTNITNKLSKLDLEFLKLENEKKNMIYSPLSIKYALLMLKEGSDGETKKQIENLLSNYTPNKYNLNQHTSLANSLFIRDSFEEYIKESYINTLNNNYDAEVLFDDFSDVKNVNGWINKKTLGIIPELFDKPKEEWQFLLINALAIDMRWADLFFNGLEYYTGRHENYSMIYPYELSSYGFENNGKTFVQGMEIETYINNYDIVKELGEENIKQTITEDYKKFVGLIDGEHKGYGDVPLGAHYLSEYEYDYNYKYTEKDVEEDLETYFPDYIKELDSNYHTIANSTNFSFYVDDNVKVFSKDLTKYDNTTIEYIGIMPTNTSLQDFIKSADSNSLNELMSKTKDIRTENFKEGVVTHIKGFIPRFNYEYTLNFKEDLQTLGMTDVFDNQKANLKNLSDADDVYIMDAIHKAKIEFTEDGIKAAAVTAFGGGGGGGPEPYEYVFDVPIEEIDLTFDKPYMYIIRDKDTEEVWFIGTVYEPETRND